MASVAAQQKSSADNLVVASAGMFASMDYSGHTDEELHNATVSALAAYTQKREEVDAYAYDVLIPALNQIIQRYKQQGRATAYRLNGCPTVEEYFKSIGLNYSTVRSWKSRAQQRLLQAATDEGTKPAPGRTSDRDPVPHFSRAERKALIEGNHRAVEMVDALEAGRDAEHEITEFKAVMNAKRLDDIMQAHEQEPDHGIAGLAISLNLWLARPVRSSIGMATILLGLPFFYYWRRRAAEVLGRRAVPAGA